VKLEHTFSFLVLFLRLFLLARMGEVFISGNENRCEIWAQFTLKLPEHKDRKEVLPGFYSRCKI
jgi:hypothetical protein